MKTGTLLSLLLIIILWGCGLTDTDSNDPDRSTGTDTTDIENSEGKYNGNWRVKYSHENGYEAHEIGDNEPYLDVLDNLEEITDSSVLAVIRGDSIHIYFYDEEVDGDTFAIEPITFMDLNEYDTTGMQGGFEQQIYNWTGAESVQFTYNDVASHSVLMGSGDAMRIEFYYNFDFNFAAQTAAGAVSGNYAASATNAYGLIRYDGVIPPDHWPENFVIDTGDTGGPQELYGSWRMMYKDPEMAITVDLLITDGEVTLTETITEIYIDINGDNIADQTLTGSEMDLVLAQEGITNPEIETGTWELNEDQISVLWEGDTVPELMPFQLNEGHLYISSSEGLMHFVKMEA